MGSWIRAIPMEHTIKSVLPGETGTCRRISGVHFSKDSFDSKIDTDGP